MMNRFSLFDIRGPWAPAGRGRRRAETGRPADVLDACRLSDSVLPANAAAPCGFSSQPY